MTIDEVDFLALNFGPTLEEWLRNQSAIAVTPPLAILHIMKGDKTGKKEPGAGGGGGGTSTGGGGDGGGGGNGDGKRGSRQRCKRPPKKARGGEGGDSAENPAKVPKWILKKGEGLGPFHKYLPKAPKIEGLTVCIKWRHLRP